MNEKINQLLQELYKYDSEFMKYENQLKQLLEELLANRPDTQFDPLFAESLRKKLLIQAYEIKSNSAPKSFWQNFASFKVAVPAFAVIALAILAGVNYFKPEISVVNVAQKELKSEKLQPLAFGSLSQSASSLAFGKGGGGGGGSAAAMPAPAQDVATSNVAPNAKMVAPGGFGGGGTDVGIMPVFENYKYIYSGEKLELTDQSVEVLRRQKGFGSNASISSLLKNFSLPNFNLKALNSASLESVTFTENRDFGYMVNVNFREGTINANENWFKWQTPERVCQDQACWDQNRLKISDVPSDSEVINIANSFLSQYGIKKDSYGEPFVQKQWLRDYEMASDKTMVWIPDVASVTYPLQINGQTVYDESGNPTGLTVNVNVRVKKVSGFYDISSQVYDRSDYPAETDWSRIVKIAEAGGNQVFYPFYEGGQSKDVEIKLGTPKKVLLKQWKNESGLEGYEILVPALVFPVLDAPANFSSYRTAITVPLVKELLKDPGSQPNQPMPLSQPKG